MTVGEMSDSLAFDSAGSEASTATDNIETSSFRQESTVLPSYEGLPAPSLQQELAIQALKRGDFKTVAQITAHMVKIGMSPNLQLDERRRAADVSIRKESPQNDSLKDSHSNKRQVMQCESQPVNISNDSKAVLSGGTQVSAWCNQECQEQDKKLREELKTNSSSFQTDSTSSLLPSEKAELEYAHRNDLVSISNAVQNVVSVGSSDSRGQSSAPSTNAKLYHQLKASPPPQSLPQDTRAPRRKGRRPSVRSCGSNMNASSAPAINDSDGPPTRTSSSPEVLPVHRAHSPPPLQHRVRPGTAHAHPPLSRGGRPARPAQSRRSDGGPAGNKDSDEARSRGAAGHGAEPEIPPATGSVGSAGMASSKGADAPPRESRF